MFRLRWADPSKKFSSVRDESGRRVARKILPEICSDFENGKDSTVVRTVRRSGGILGELDALVDIGALAEKEVIQ
jgi:hypothetical protein